MMGDRRSHSISLVYGFILIHTILQSHSGEYPNVFLVKAFPIIHQRRNLIAQQQRTFQLNVKQPQKQDFSESNLKPRRRKQSVSKPSFSTAQTTTPAEIEPSDRSFNDYPLQDSTQKNNVVRLDGRVDDDSSSSGSSETTIGCEHFGTCPGCSVMDNVASVDVIRSARLFFDSLERQRHTISSQQQQSSNRPRQRTTTSGSSGGTTAPTEEFQFRVVIPTASVRQWRTQAKLVVAAPASKNPWSKSGSGGTGCVFGLYQRNSHSVVSIPQCQVHHPSINQAVQALEMATARVQTPACMEENSSSGSSSSSSSTTTTTNANSISSSLRSGLRYVQLQVERTTGKICLTLVWFARDVKETQPALSRLTKELVKTNPQLWHSIWLHCHDGLGNNIFSRSSQSAWHLLSGPEFLREPLPSDDYNNDDENIHNDDDASTTDSAKGKGGPWLYFTPHTFRQANLDGFEKLAMHVARVVPPGAKVCELYAGVGVLGLTTLYHHALHHRTPLTWLRCSDENPYNPRCFQRAVSSLPSFVSGREPGKSRKPFKSRHSTPEKFITMGQLAERMNNPDAAPTNKRQNVVDQGEKTSYMVASAGKALLSGQALGANVLIVDPPRKGLDEDVLVELCKPINSYQDDSWESPLVLPIADDKVNWVNSVKTLIYVSCGFEALTRDCDRLFSNRAAGWSLESATGYLLFPGSDHVETICVFQRK